MGGGCQEGGRELGKRPCGFPRCLPHPAPSEGELSPLLLPLTPTAAGEPDPPSPHAQDPPRPGPMTLEAPGPASLGAETRESPRTRSASPGLPLSPGLIISSFKIHLGDPFVAQQLTNSTGGAGFHSWPRSVG